MASNPPSEVLRPRDGEGEEGRTSQAKGQALEGNLQRCWGAAAVPKSNFFLGRGRGVRSKSRRSHDIVIGCLTL